MARKTKTTKPRKTRNMVAFALIVQAKNRVFRDRRLRREGDRSNNWRKEID